MNYYLVTRIAFHIGDDRIHTPAHQRNNGFEELRRALTGDNDVFFIYPEQWARRRMRLEWLAERGIDHHYLIHDVSGASAVASDKDDYRRYLLLCVPSDHDAFELRLHFDMLPVPVDLDGLDRYVTLLNWESDEDDDTERPIWL